MERKRIDVWLSKLKGDFSRSACQKFIRDFGVTVNGKKIFSPHFGVCEGDKISFSEKDFELFVSGRAVREDAVFRKELVLAEEKGEFFVIDKPAGVTTEELVNGYFSVHRLDKNTSGLLVIAQNQKAQALLQAQWQKRSVQKTYVTLVKGHLTPKKGEIDAGIERSVKDRKKMAVSALNSARQAVTSYEVLEYFSQKFGKEVVPCSLVRAFPKTGRTHQIRVHFSSIGHPVIGDDRYGDKKINALFEKETGLARQFLHAAELELKNPITGKNVHYKSKLPDDLAHVMVSLSNHEP